jgi:hypothetical protein
VASREKSQRPKDRRNEERNQFTVKPVGAFGT